MKRVATAWLAARMLGWLLVLPLLKRLMPLPSLVALMWVDRPRRARATGEEVERLSRITRWVAFRVWPRRAGTCLEQSLVLYRVLSARGVAPELIIGVRRADERVGAHAWVAVAGTPVGDMPGDLSAFAPVISFGARGLPLHEGTLAASLL